MGELQFPKDDIESLIYVIIYLIKGNLPWQNAMKVMNEDRIRSIGKIKEGCTSYELCKDLPAEFMKILDYIKCLKYGKIPDYSMIKGLISKIALDNQLQLDKKFEWSDTTQKQIKKPTIVIKCEDNHSIHSHSMKLSRSKKQNDSLV